MKKRVILMIILAVAIAVVILSSLQNIISKQTSFELNPILFKIILNQGESVSTTLNIKNLGNYENFSFKIGDLDNILSLEKNSLIIRKGESKSLNIGISGANSSYGIYVGHLSVSNSLKEKKIPVITSIHTSKQMFAINLNVAPENKQLKKKDNLIAEIKFFNLFDSKQHTVQISYEILNLYGEKILSDSEKITIGSKSSFTKKFPLPKDIVLGDYVFVVSLSYSDTITTASYLFSVVDKKQEFSFLNINLLALIVVIFVVLTFFLILYVLYERNRLFSQLRKQHRLQIMHSSRNILNEAQKYVSKTKNEKQKRRIIGEFKDAKKEIIKELKKQQKKQIKELGRLKNKRNITKERKLLQWRKESYSKALDAAQISSDLKNKLAALKTAYDEGFIKKESYAKGVSKIKSANKKLKRNVYK